MKFLDTAQRKDLIGQYSSPAGLYEYTKGLPFLGSVTSNVQGNTLVAGQWTEIVLTYTVGASGLADGAWIKGTFKFYSDWALFQTSDRTKDDHVSVEYAPNDLLPGQTPATVQDLRVRFDQKGHERPFQKAVIIDVVDGYLNPGDKIIIRLGDRRFGAKGTRVQTFVESNFRWRFYIDPIGTSRFAPIRPDISWDVVPGGPHHLVILSPRVVRPGVRIKIHSHAEDVWGNVTKDTPNLSLHLEIIDGDRSSVSQRRATLPSRGWSNAIFEDISLPKPGHYTIQAELKDEKEQPILFSSIPFTVREALLVPKLLYGDLHVHSDDTVGTEDSTYNFSYGRDIAALDVLGYTANDFQITKTRWDVTVSLIQSINEPSRFVLFPGTEWCGNSAAGGDHNVVFLADPGEHPPDFPFDRFGNVARSFEWSEDGPDDLIPGAWPLDELYATYASSSKTHLLIPHVGGRRCNLAWHHPELERLLEIGSAWGQFEWLLRDAVTRGWKMGVSANSDEHRGRCGGGVPGTAVFGTRGGLTGILADSLDRGTIATALRARHTFATTGPRLAATVTTDHGYIQGDEFHAPSSTPLSVHYSLFGDKGFHSIEAWDASGCFWKRDLWQESQAQASLVRVTWGGARLHDRYREAVWNGSINISEGATLTHTQAFGGLSFNPEDEVDAIDTQTVRFASRTSGDVDGVHVSFVDDKLPDSITVTGALGGYVKVGDSLSGNPHCPQPTFSFDASRGEIMKPEGRRLDIEGGAGLFVAVRAIPDIRLPTEVHGVIEVSGTTGQERAIYLVGREWVGDKVISSPLFVSFT